jgi:3-hydroxyisobutyrate dehydrogenase-like beta-hydroxyacid dehydrogenase
MIETVGILHPGRMGISVAASVKNAGYEVVWVSEGRSRSTRQRAEDQTLVEVRNLDGFCRKSDVIISVCPPHAAEDVAEAVLQHGFSGIYIDANAVSPQRVKRIAERMDEAGVPFVDASIIGGPAWTPGRTWLYLSGEEVGEIESLFKAGPLEWEVIGDRVGQASALKMCFAAYTKGTNALLCAIMAAAEELGVRGNLEKQWSRGGSEFAERTKERVRRVTAKAWRFEGEMHEIAETFEEVGIPGGFHHGAAEIYRRIALFKNESEVPALEDVLQALLKKEGW